MDNIKKLLSLKENRKFEFKESLPSNDKIIKSAIAFSNSQRGHLIIGVKNNNELIGSNIKVAIYDDMIEITSPGVLIIDKEKLGLGYLFKKLNIIEQWGTGYEKIQKELKNYPEITMQIDDDSSFTQVKFIKKEYISKTDGGINELFEYIKNNPNQKANQISQSLNIPLRTIQRWLKKLNDENKIEFIGSKKTGGCFIKKGYYDKT